MNTGSPCLITLIWTRISSAKWRCNIVRWNIICLHYLVTAVPVVTAVVIRPGSCCPSSKISHFLGPALLTPASTPPTSLSLLHLCRFVCLALCHYCPQLKVFFLLLLAQGPGTGESTVSGGMWQHSSMVKSCLLKGTCWAWPGRLEQDGVRGRALFSTTRTRRIAHRPFKV